MEACTNLHCWVLCQQQLNVTLIDWIHFWGNMEVINVACCSSIRCATTFVDQLLNLSVSIIDLDRLSRSSNNACRVLRSWYFVCFHVLSGIKLFWLRLPELFPVQNFMWMCFRQTEFLYNSFNTCFLIKHGFLQRSHYNWEVEIGAEEKILDLCEGP